VTVPMWVSVGVALAACVTDLRHRRVPNVLTLGAAGVAVAFHAASPTGSGLLFAVFGWGVGLLVFLPLFAVRGIGGGDVKLLAALGAWLGPSMVLWVAAYAAIAGGAFALVVSAMHGYTRQAFSNVWGLLSYWRVMGVQTHPGLTLDATTAPRLPYALPMAAGLGMTLWLR
jgi:prepilin peptidase CpaA